MPCFKGSIIASHNVMGLDNITVSDNFMSLEDIVVSDKSWVNINFVFMTMALV